jgi:hypothetical protein
VYNYYELQGNQTSTYYCAGFNNNDEFEFYHSDDNRNWVKNKISFQSKDEFGCRYTVENNKDEACLVVPHQTNELYLIFKQTTPSSNMFEQNRALSFILRLIDINSLPSTLAPIKDNPGISTSAAGKENFSKIEEPRISSLDPTENKSKEDKTYSGKCNYISLQILGGFMAVLGGIAVALAFTVLNSATLGGLGIAALILGVGFFAAGTYMNGQKGEADQDLVLSEDILLNN